MFKQRPTMQARLGEQAREAVNNLEMQVYDEADSVRNEVEGTLGVVQG